MCIGRESYNLVMCFPFKVRMKHTETIFPSRALFLLTSAVSRSIPSLPVLGSESFGRLVVRSISAPAQEWMGGRERERGGFVEDKHHIGGSTGGGENREALNIVFSPNIDYNGKTRPIVCDPIHYCFLQSVIYVTSE